MLRSPQFSYLMVPLLLAGLAACSRPRAIAVAAPQTSSCVSPMGLYLRSSVYLDRSNTPDPQRPYSEEEWERFINEVLIRHMPDGGTVFDNTGWWRRPNGTTFRGIGRTLVVLDPVADSTQHRASVAAVIEEIKQRYGHRLVIREEARVCAAF